MEALEQMQIAGAQIHGLIHVGAHKGQERYLYRDAGISPVIYVEPADATYAVLREYVSGIDGHIPVQALCTLEAGKTVRLNISSNDGESSSILDLGSHSRYFPSITYTGHQDIVSTTVDALLLDDMHYTPNLLVIDTQGADLKVLQGAVRSLTNHIVGVYVEVSETPLYEGGCTFDQVTSFLSTFGFRLRWTNVNGWGHGNAFYFKPS